MALVKEHIQEVTYTPSKPKNSGRNKVVRSKKSKILESYKMPPMGRSIGLELLEASFIKRMLAGEFSGRTEKSLTDIGDRKLFSKYKNFSPLQLKRKFSALTRG